MDFSLPNIDIGFSGLSHDLLETHMGFGQWYFDMETNLMTISEGTKNLFQISKSQITFDEFLKIIHPDDQKNIVEALSETKNTGKPRPYNEFRIVTQKGDKTMRSNSLKELKKDGKLMASMGVFVDYTENKKREEMQQKTLRDLNKSNEALTEFAYTASHDLQEPLRKIEAYSNRLKSSLGETLSDKSKNYLDKLMSSATRMSGLIDDIMALSRLNNVSTEFELIDLHNIIENLLEDFEYTIKDKKATVTFDLPVIKGSRTQFQQLFHNLLGNALKFIAPDRKPMISFTCEKASKEDFKKYGLLPKKQYYKIIVQDNGIGFDQQFEAKIYAPFKRLIGHSEYPGSGIGLAICKKVVENHDGLLRAESSEGKGATFYVFLPE